jgi:hypothetical protein
VSAEHDLQQLLRQWEALTQEMRTGFPAAARAEGEYRRTRAKEIRTLVFDDKMPVTRAEAMTDGSEQIGELLLDRLVKAADVEAMKLRAKWFEAEADRLRSLSVTERAQDALHTTRGQG